MNTMKKTYYRDLDIIRVLSCILVLLYHLNILKGGYLAVCIFFVLSGYLSIISAFRKEKFSILTYYKERLIHIYIPLLIVVFITLGVISFIPSIKIDSSLISIVSAKTLICSILYNIERWFTNSFGFSLKKSYS